MLTSRCNAARKQWIHLCTLTDQHWCTDIFFNEILARDFTQFEFSGIKFWWAQKCPNLDAVTSSSVSWTSNQTHFFFSCKKLLGTNILQVFKLSITTASFSIPLGLLYAFWALCQFLFLVTAYSLAFPSISLPLWILHFHKDVLFFL